MMLSASGSGNRAAAGREFCIDFDHITLRKKAVNVEGGLLSAFPQHFLEEFVDNEHWNDQLPRSFDWFGEVEALLVSARYSSQAEESTRFMIDPAPSR